MPVSIIRTLARQWTGHLGHYRRHKNVEHLEALVDEAVRYAGLHLENELSDSSYWSAAPLARRAAVLLFLVDRGVVTRSTLDGRIAYRPTDGAETWIASHPGLSAYIAETLELVAALRLELGRRTRRRAS